MPLSRIQSEILQLLAAHRNPESYVAGSLPINREGPRFSADIDVFHDREEMVEQVAALDAATLNAAGFAVRWLRREPGIYSALTERHGESMRLEWVRDSDFRFYPAVPDKQFGYMLHAIDIATNKALAAAGRRAPRDILDLLFIDERHLRLGAVIWAAVGKDPGFSPENLIGEIRRNARYRSEDYEALLTAKPIDAGLISRRFRAAVEKADAFVRAMPSGKEGLLFLENGVPVQPDPNRLSHYMEHAGRRRGHWPSSPEIGSAMLERYGKPPT